MWASKRKIIEYVKEHYKDIQYDMNLTLFESKQSKQEFEKKTGTTKKRKYLSQGPSINNSSIITRPQGSIIFDE